ncbi:FtsW/RodA/SpoVE family cell cycle protein [Cellulomonas triticagri]|uniref:FtsW/RodA/SpoVE family cell cycle protein n=2 Tax=Cellulomonas triticagri TaxID=2483352 RepID=A0A3M2IQI1_9CELL|nr:FtsW/RodA/SpoVE family cell cycle protein [Cellulomonas triticagri]
MTGALPDDLPVYAATLAVPALVVHGVVRWRAPHADPLVLPVVVALNGTGLAMIHRLDLARIANGREGEFAGRQLGWSAVSVVLACLVLVLLRDHRVLRRYSYTAMAAGLVLLVLPMAPVIGATINGSRVWVRAFGMSFQPSELAKLALAVFFAGYLVTHRDNLTLTGRRVLGLHLPRLRYLAPLLVVWAVSLGVMFAQRDLGSSLLLFGIFVAMLYVATERISWIVLGLGLAGAQVAVAASHFGYVQARFDVWLHALDPDIFERHPGGSGQLVRGLFGMADGGLLGRGWGQGRPDLVPYAESDFIMASLGEELGLTGVAALLVLSLLLCQRGLRTAIGLRDGFGKLLAAGLSFGIALQCFIVLGGITRLIPLTGLTMPFLAYGGSSLVVNWVVAAVLLRLSDRARRPAPAEEPDRGRDAVAAG